MLSYREKLAKDLPIWVKNMISTPPSVVVMTFSYNNATRIVKIPPSKYAFQIYPGMVTKEMLLQGGQDLDHFLGLGVLKMVKTKEAKKLIKEGSREEADSILLKANNDAAFIKWARDQKEVSEGLDSANPKMENFVKGPSSTPEELGFNKTAMDLLKEKLARESGGPSKSRHQMAMSGSAEGVSPRVVGIMAMWRLETDEGVLNDLINYKEHLTPSDLTYVLRTCQRHCRTYKWASNLLERN